ncbi:hypothetical protein B188_23100 [Candidatus Brocadiaceae bacterium B188]|nr:O-antigen ligase family protein [Candidatus Brocadia sapporoensis]TWU49887.1 hypothetical protein B188_23100 [Candidatus Brocadiaceae bacterium B188]
MLKSKKINSLQLLFSTLPQSKVITIFIWTGLIPLAIILSYAILHSLMVLCAIVVSAVCAILFFRPEWGLYLLIGLVPFQLFPMAFFSSDYSWSIAQLLVKFLFVVTVFRIIQSRKFCFPHSSLNVWILLFTFVSISSTVNTSDLREHIKGTIPKVIDLFLLYFVVSYLVDTKKKLQIVVNIFLVVSFLVTSLGILQIFGKIEILERYLQSDMVSLFVGPGYAEIRTEMMLSGIEKDRFKDVVSLFVNHSDYGGFLLYSFPLALGLFVTEKKSKIKFFYGSLAFLFGMNILFSLARSAWLGLFAIAVFFAIVAFRHNVRFIVLLFCAIIGIISCVWFMEVSYHSFLPSSIQERFQSTVLQGERSNSFQIRLGWWLESIQLVFRTPLTVLFGTTILFKTHNLYIQTLLLFGSLGLFTLFCILLSALHKLYKSFRSSNDSYLQGISFGACAGLIGLIVHSLLWNDLYYVPSNDMLFAVFLGLATVLPTLSGHQEISNGNIRHYNQTSSINNINSYQFMNGIIISLALIIAMLANIAVIFFEFSPFDIFSYAALLVIILLVFIETGAKAKISTNRGA